MRSVPTGCKWPRIAAEHNRQDAKKRKFNECKLEPALYLAKGSPMQLTMNLAPMLGLVNGSKGNMDMCLYPPGRSPPDQPAGVVAYFPDFRGESFLPDKDGMVLLEPTSVNWEVTKTDQAASRKTHSTTH